MLAEVLSKELSLRIVASLYGGEDDDYKGVSENRGP